MVDYLDEAGVSGLLEMIELGDSNSPICATTGGGFNCILKLARLSLGNYSARKAMRPCDPYDQLALVIKAFQAHAGKSYFESLDDAFVGAPEADDGCAWVYVNDRFTLTNLGGVGIGLVHRPAYEKLKDEKRFVFRIDPLRGMYVDSDDYFKRPKRAWHLTMIASFWRCPSLEWRPSWEWSDESIYFHWPHFIDIPLNVFGVYLKTGLQVRIIPYAIWA